jgi:hypothetical protein
MSVKLPICSDRALLALIRMELEIGEEEMEKQLKVQDVKAIVASL